MSKNAFMPTAASHCDRSVVARRRGGRERRDMRRVCNYLIKQLGINCITTADLCIVNEYVRSCRRKRVVVVVRSACFLTIRSIQMTSFCLLRNAVLCIYACAIIFYQYTARHLYVYAGIWSIYLHMRYLHGITLEVMIKRLRSKKRQEREF